MFHSSSPSPHRAIPDSTSVPPYSCSLLLLISLSPSSHKVGTGYAHILNETNHQNYVYVVHVLIT